MVYSLNGEIYRGEYKIQVGLDSSCSIESLTITDVSQQ
jgi:hypothetical protein